MGAWMNEADLIPHEPLIQAFHDKLLRKKAQVPATPNPPLVIDVDASDAEPIASTSSL